MGKEDLNLMGIDSYDKNVHWNGQGTLKILRGSGGHETLEFLNSSMNIPLMYSPGPSLSSMYTKNLRDLL